MVYNFRRQCESTNMPMDVYINADDIKEAKRRLKKQCEYFKKWKLVRIIGA